MDDLFRNLTGPQVIGLAAVVFGTLGVTTISVVGAVVPQWNRAKRTATEAQLKRDMIAAGFSADDIERVVRATAPDDASRAGRPASSRVG